MVYLVTFLEGLITFISPCLLPMLPIYLSYFAGGQPDASRGRVLKNALGFVLGFTLLFVAMGAFAGSIGALLTRHQQAVNIVSGLIVIFFGLNFLGVFRLSLFRGSKGYSVGHDMGFFSALIFGCGLCRGLDSLRRGFPWFGPGTGLPAGLYPAGDSPAAVLLRRPGHPVFGQRPAHPVPENCL